MLGIVFMNCFLKSTAMHLIKFYLFITGETRMPSPAEPRPAEVRDIIFPFKGETVWRLEVQHMLEVS